MVNIEPRKVFAQWPTAPGAGATIILVSTHPRSPGGVGAVQPATITALQIPSTSGRKVAVEDLDAVTVTWLSNDAASAANGLRAYAWYDGNWYEIDHKNEMNAATIGAAAPIQVPILAAGQEWKERFDFAGYEGWCLEYTAGGAPTVWRGSICLHVNVGAVEL